MGGFPVTSGPLASTDACPPAAAAAAAAAVCGGPFPALASNVGSVTDPQFPDSVPRGDICASRGEWWGGIVLLLQ